MWPAVKSGVYTTGNDQLRVWTKKLLSTSESQTCTKKGHGHCLVVCCPSDPLQFSWIGETTISDKLCSANWWDAQKTAMHAASRCSTKDPVLLHDASLHGAQSMLQKLNELGYSKVLSQLPYSPKLLPTNYHFFKNLRNFLQEKAFTMSRRPKTLF